MKRQQNKYNHNIAIIKSISKSQLLQLINRDIDYIDIKGCKVNLQVPYKIYLRLNNKHKFTIDNKRVNGYIVAEVVVDREEHIIISHRYLTRVYITEILVYKSPKSSTLFYTRDGHRASMIVNNFIYVKEITND